MADGLSKGEALAAGGSGRLGHRQSWYAALVVAILLVATGLRFVALDQYPLPLHQDELSDMYDGYSLATTGTDRHGDRWPILIHGMGPGDYHPGLYVYLAAVTTGLGGFSVGMGRLPAAIAGVLTVVLVFMAARSLLGRRAAVLALLFVAFSPVHILYSRQAHAGACLPPLFAILVVYLLCQSLAALTDRHRRRWAYAWVAGAGLAIGLSTSSYGAARLSGLLFALFGTALLVIQVGFRRGAWRRAGVVAAVFAVATGLGAAPQLYAMMTEPEQFFTRAANVVPPLSNSLRWWVKKLIINTGLNLDPRYLFFSMGEYRLLTVAGLSIVSLPFLYVGLLGTLVRTCRRQLLPGALVLGATVICLMPAVVSRSNPNPMRASGVWALYPLLTAMGAVIIGNAIRSSWGRLTTNARGTGQNRRERNRSLRFGRPLSFPSRRGGRDLQPGQGGVHGRARFLTLEKAPAGHGRAGLLGAALLGVAIAVVGALNVARYLHHPEWHGLHEQNRLVRIGEWVGEHGDEYARVYVDAPGLFPYLYLAVFSGMSPAEFQRAPREGTLVGLGWEDFRRFGRFHFATAKEARKAWRSSAQTGRWVLVTADGEPVEFTPQRQARGQW